MENLCSGCNKGILSPFCISCRTKKIASFLSLTEINLNNITHSIRDVRKKFDSINMTVGAGNSICYSCNNEIVFLCHDCYFSKIKNVLYFYFNESTVDKLNRINLLRS